MWQPRQPWPFGNWVNFHLMSQKFAAKVLTFYEMGNTPLFLISIPCFYNILHINQWQNIQIIGHFLGLSLFFM